MSKIKFIPDSHQYMDEKGELKSVSRFTDEFKPKVDWKEVAKRSAAKLTKAGTPTTVEQLLQKWANKRDKSAEAGTLFHQIKEQELLNTINPEFYGIECKQEEASYEDGHKVSIPISELQNNTVYPELMTYDLDHMICGQADKVIVVKNTINVWDYKTDMEISFVGWSNQWTSPRKLLKPLDHLDDCNGNIYAIKMSLYMYMLWKANKGKFKPGELIIEHVTLKRDQENDNIPMIEDGRPVILDIKQIKLPYLKKEVMAMLKTIKQPT